jgi:hypothetical protein
MKREDVYEVHPIESVYGVIQVKSRLTKKELHSGLRNLASFKRLEPPASRQTGFIPFTHPFQAERGFALLFAYVGDMSWMDVIRELEMFAKSNPARTLPNAIYILDRGYFLFGDGDGAHLFNKEIEAIQTPQMHGYPDREGLCLYEFQSQLLALLRHTAVHPAQLDPYFRLPLVAEGLSYAFTMGNFAEVGHCDHHGDFQRKISPQALETLIRWCSAAEPINWIKATNIAYNLPDNEEAYRRQPGDVHIYNPESLPFSDILLMDGVVAGRPVRSLAFDSISAAGITIWVPYHYTVSIRRGPQCCHFGSIERLRRSGLAL